MGWFLWRHCSFSSRQVVRSATKLDPLSVKTSSGTPNLENVSNKVSLFSLPVVELKTLWASFTVVPNVSS